MTYTVLARKYRPQTFADLVGQEHVSRTIANAIATGRVAHAFLFTGARGVGKTTTARLLAKSLNCERGPTHEPCNQCDPCREITAGSDIDVLEIDGASNNSVDDVRRLQESLPYRPVRDRFKVVIVDEVHMLSTGAFNAFLKTLEEPPPHVKFVFATTEAHKVPVTIRSRCQRHDFRLISHAVVAQRVRGILAAEGIATDDDAVAIVAREAAGSMRDALTLLDQLLAFGAGKLVGEEVARGLGVADRKDVLAVTEALLAHDAASCVRAVAALSEQGLDMLHFVRQLASFARDLVILKVVGDDPSLVELVEEERARANALASSVHALELERTFAGVAKLVDEVGQAAMPQLVLEMGLVRLADRPALEPLSELLARLSRLEARLSSGGGTPGSLGGPAGSRGGDFPSAPRNSAPPRVEPKPAPKAVTPESQAEAPRTLSAPRAPAAQPAVTERAVTEPSMDGDPFATWRTIVERLQHAQPALAAVLEHGTPVSVSREKLCVSFPEGSFFGRQASASAAQQALADTAMQVLGARPRIEIGYGLVNNAPTMAAEQAAARSEARAKAIETALSHPRVREAIEVFEAEGNVQVELE